MVAHFHINYKTHQGEYITLQFRKKGKIESVICQTYDGFNWTAAVSTEENTALEYKYFIQTAKGWVGEQGDFRSVKTPKGTTHVFYDDSWRTSAEAERTYFSAAFKDVLFKRTDRKKSAAIKINPSKNQIVFQLYAAAIPQHLSFGIVGNTEALGQWKKPILLSDASYPLWEACVEVEGNSTHFEYKFVMYDTQKNMIVEWEGGDNRSCHFTFPSHEGNVLIRTDESYQYPTPLWRGAGLAIPVFSLRSENGLGIGEFTDIKLVVDWAKKTAMRLVQVLPVNDTIATKTWVDSYPYAAISVFALHPLYVNIPSIAPLKDKKAQKELAKVTKDLNALETVDFEQVLNYKFKYFKLLYEQESAAFFKNKDVQKFIEDNADWLKPYAAFCHLRDLNGTVQFHKWAEYSTFSLEVVEQLCTPQYERFDEVALYYFIQYHAHQQLFGATEYARANGVILKGDLPIGIYRYSCDAWVAPHLYNMDGQAGAPPDAYAVAGQNWGFPTYNWEVMSRDNFAWWRQRMTKLSEYFDALRIDHILGFFRIWQIPTQHVEGTLGLFNPRLPYSRQELNNMGLQGALERFTEPYIRGHFLGEIFGGDTEFVIQEFLDSTAPNEFKLKPFVDTQVKIKELFLAEKYLDKKHLEKPLMRLVGEVLLIEEPLSNGTAFNPRITIHTTRSYQELDDRSKHIMNQLYGDYFFVRHDEFWKQQALWKLPAIVQATNMLICGEDLGMIPNSVPGVMHDLNIIALEIQRMPKGATEFGETERYPYMTVCSPSCHDMSTIRGWWESDYGQAERFYHRSLKRYGVCPAECTPEIVEAINQQHLDTPSMWAIFPIQDLVGMNATLRRPIATDEQINEPSNPQHYWRFRFHLTMEELLKQEDLNNKIVRMVQLSGRNR